MIFSTLVWKIMIDCLISFGVVIFIITLIWKANQNYKLIKEREQLIEKLLKLNKQLEPYLNELDDIKQKELLDCNTRSQIK